MKVKLATTAGFCMGVRRAMEMALAAANKEEGPLFTYGPLIHNKQVLELLESKNVKAVDDITDIEKGILLIRAHGISPQQRRKLNESPLKIIDATCPRVAKVQSIIHYHTRKGYLPVIVGDRDHAEVIGLMGFGDGKALVINSSTEVLTLPETDKLFLVAQTTQNKELFDKIAETVKKRYPGALIFETICEATSERQKEVKSLANHTDAVVVVGGYHSGNTRRLVQVSEGTGTATFHVETEKELDKDKLSSMDTIGVTAGASTPNWMIKNVVKEIEAIRSRGETFLGRWLKICLKFILLSNLLVAMGAFSFTYAATILLGRRPNIFHSSLVFLYIYAMYALNRFLDKGASTYNDPERASFYRKHRNFLISTGIIAEIGALALTYYLGTTLFFAMAILSLLGIIYSIPIVPSSLRHRWRFSKIKDIPGSRTLSETLAWAMIITLLPLLEPFHMSWGLVVIVSFFIVLAIVFIRSAFFDIFQTQGDLIVGVETMPIILGERKTIILLKYIIVTTSLLLIIAPLLNLVSPFSLLLLLCLITLSLCLMAYEKNLIYPGMLFEYLVEGNLFLAGFLGLLWQILS